MKKQHSEEQIRARLRELTEEARRSRSEFSQSRSKRLRFEPRGKPSTGPPGPPGPDTENPDEE